MRQIVLAVLVLMCLFLLSAPTSGSADEARRKQDESPEKIVAKRKSEFNTELKRIIAESKKHNPEEWYAEIQAEIGKIHANPDDASLHIRIIDLLLSESQRVMTILSAIESSPIEAMQANLAKGYTVLEEIASESAQSLKQKASEAKSEVFKKRYMELSECAAKLAKAYRLHSERYRAFPIVKVLEDCREARGFLDDLNAVFIRLKEGLTVIDKNSTLELLKSYEEDLKNLHKAVLEYGTETFNAALSYDPDTK